MCRYGRLFSEIIQGVCTGGGVSMVPPVVCSHRMTLRPIGCRRRVAVDGVCRK